VELDVAVVLAAREGEVSRAGARLREDLRGQGRVDGVRFDCRAGSHEARHAREARGLVLSRPEADWVRRFAMTHLGNGLAEADRSEEALVVEEAELSTLRRVGATKVTILRAKTNLAVTYTGLGRTEDSLKLEREVYSGYLKLYGENHERTIRAANNYAVTLMQLDRFEEARPLLRKMRPVARRVLGESHDITLLLRSNYAEGLFNADGATLEDLREATTTLEDIVRIARRVFGGSHPLTETTHGKLQGARAALRVRETPPGTRGD
jgi:hypothetical protein